MWRSPTRTSSPATWAKKNRCVLSTTKSQACSSVCLGGNNMSLLSFFRGQKKTSASVARDRLQLILINERGDGAAPDYLPQLQKELVEVISRYVKINPDDIRVNLERQDSLEILEVKIEMPQAEVRS